MSDKKTQFTKEDESIKGRMIKYYAFKLDFFQVESREKGKEATSI